MSVIRNGSVRYAVGGSSGWGRRYTTARCGPYVAATGLGTAPKKADGAASFSGCSGANTDSHRGKYWSA